MAQNNTITFYDLALSTGATISPFVWATKYALKHKGFDLDVVPGGFTKIPERTGGKTERLPAIVDDGKWVLDSWGIVEYLDETYPDRPMLIPHPSVAIMTRALDAWFWSVATGPWMRCNCVNYRDLANPEDHEYITYSREKMLGKTLEEMQHGWEDRLAGISASLEPLRIALREAKYLGGDTPNYADYRILGSILFTASVCRTSPVLAADDPLRPWIDSLLDMYGGLGRHPGLFDLFGLEQREGDPPLFMPAGLGGIHKRNTGPDSTRAETQKITEGMAKA
jgi:glutathione S-transferase